MDKFGAIVLLVVGHLTLHAWKHQSLYHPNLIKDDGSHLHQDGGIN